MNDLETLQQENDLLRRKNAHLNDDVVALRNGIREINKLANEIDKWASKIIYKHINGRGEGQWKHTQIQD